MPLRTRTNSFLGKQKRERNKLTEMEQKSSQTIEMQLIGQDFAQTTFPPQLQLILFPLSAVNYSSTKLFIASLTGIEKVFFFQNCAIRNLFTFNLKKSARDSWAFEYNLIENFPPRPKCNSVAHECLMLHLTDDLFTTIKSCWLSYAITTTIIRVMK